MVVIKDGEKYYTTEELSKLLDKDFEKGADKFVEKVLKGQRNNKISNDITYV